MCVILWGWDSWGVVRADWSCAFNLVLLYFLRKMINVNCSMGYEGKLIQKIQVKVTEEGFPHISARGYIII